MAISTSNLDLLLPQLKQLPTWFEEWSSTPDERISTLIDISSVLESVDLVSALKYLKDAHTDAAAAKVSIPSEQTTKLIKLSLSVSSFFDYDTIYAIVSSLSGIDSELLSLLKIFVNGTLSDYKAFPAASVTAIGLDAEELTTKIRLLTLASLASASPNLTVPYSAIALALAIDDEQVEFWIIDVIRAGLLEGKMSQLEQKLYIHRVVTRTFGPEQWADISRRLDVWKTSLKDVLAVVRNARVSVENKVAALNTEKERVVAAAGATATNGEVTV